MSRAVSGNYTLPGGVNPVVNTTTITVTWANTTLDDIATALTDSLSRSGSGAMLAPLKSFSGSEAAPGITFSSESSTGFYLQAANSVRFSLGGSDLMALTASGVHCLVGNFNGNVVGNVTGNVVGNVTGDVSGTAGNVTGVVAVANGGTGASSAATARTALGAAASGANADITSLTGLSAGGLPNSSVLTADIADANITAAKLDGAQSGAAPIFGVRAWVRFNGTGTPAISGQGNVASITDRGVGMYTATFTTAMADNNYAFAGSAGFPTLNTLAAVSGSDTVAPASGSVAFDVFTDAGVRADASFINLMVIR